MKTQATPCKNCGKPLSEHILTNHCDPPFIGGHVYVCPVATFKATEPNEEDVVRETIEKLGGGV